MKNKILLIGILMLLVLPLIIAETEIETETHKVNEQVILKFICTLNNEIPTAAATYNISIAYPNGSTFIDETQTTALGNGAFSYTTTFPISGLYKVQMFCWDATYSFSDEGFYEITPTGQIQTSILDNPLLLVLGILGLVLVIFGTLKGIPWFGFIGAVMFLMLGIYTMIYGFNNTTDLYTRGVAIVLLGMGFVFMFSAAYEWLYADED